MDWKNLGVFATLLAVFVTMWWQLDRKIEYEISALQDNSALLDRSISTLDRKIDQLNTLSKIEQPDNALNRDIGELQGRLTTHRFR